MIACIALWSIFFPGISGRSEIAQAALTLSTPGTVATVSTTIDMKVEMEAVNGVYYLSFVSSTAGSSYVYMSTSSDAGTWSSPTTITDELQHDSAGDYDANLDIMYWDRNGYFAMTYLATSTNPIFATSSDGITWATSTMADVFSDEGRTCSLSGSKMAVAAATSSDYIVVGCGVKDTDYSAIVIATSTNGGSWATSSFHAVVTSTFSIGNSDLFVGVTGNSGSETTHVMYSYMDQTLGAEVFYASSTDSGATYTTTTITSGDLYQGQSAHFRELGFAINSSGEPAMIYNFRDALTGGPTSFNVTTTLTYAIRSSGTWTTSSIRTASGTVGSAAFMGYDLFFHSGESPVVLAPGGVDFAPSVSINTSTFKHTTFEATQMSSESGASIAYNTSTAEFAFAYVVGGNLRVSTSSLIDADYVPSVPTSLAAAVASTSSLSITWGDGNFETSYVLRAHTGSTTSTEVVVTSTPAENATSATLTGLSPNVQYLVSLYGTNAHGNGAMATATLVYTHANVAGAPTLTASSTSATVLTITIDANSNPTSTTYAIDKNDATDNRYIDSAGGATSTAVYQTTSSWNGISVTGLTANTSYNYEIIARNGDSVSAAASTASTAYSGATIPTSLSATGGTEQVTLSWTGDGTSYVLKNNNSGSTVSVAGVSSVATGLTCGTTYTFSVAALNVDDFESSYSSTASATTDACPGGGSAAPAAPAAPAVAAPVVSTVSGAVGSSQSISVGNVSHTVTVNAIASDGSATVVIQSDPITLTLAPEEEVLLDTDSDGRDDLYVRHDGISGDQVSLAFLSLVDSQFLINNGFLETENAAVTLSLNSSDAAYMAISNSLDFSGIGFVPYASEATWELGSGNGEKTVYVKLRTAAGGEKTVSDTITLVGQNFDAEDLDTDINTSGCGLVPEKAYKAPASSAVYYVSDAHNEDGTVNQDVACTKRPFESSQKYFTYFESWDDVVVTTQTSLDSIENDVLGFMPWGQLYDPQYGALVKVTTDPKVYLLLNDEKYWITSETVFEALSYSWDWIEDIDQALLETYTVGSEITDTDTHPKYTLVKYEDSSEVYRLEPGLEDSTTVVKRHIANEQAFESLGFRWDRIVTISDEELYNDGTDLE